MVSDWLVGLFCVNHKLLIKKEGSMGQCIKAERPVEMFGILQRLPEITTSVGTLAVSKALELVHGASLFSLFEFMGEGLEITFDQFLDGYVSLLARMNSEDGVITDRDAVIGYVRVNGVLMFLSWEGRCLYGTAPNDPDVGWPLGTIVLSPFFQPIPILPLQQSLAL